MHPNSILQIIPPREIENYINRLKPTSLHVYVDFKNSCRSLFIEDVVKEFKDDFKESKDGARKMISYLKKDWIKVKKALF